MKETSRVKPIAIMITLGVLIVATFIINLNLGIIRLSPLEVWRTFFGQGTAEQSLVLFHFRLPRVVISLLIGAGLGVAGAILQGISRNGLAGPGILGINAGASLAVVIFVYFFLGTGNVARVNYSILPVFVMPFSALLGASLAALLVYTLAWKNGITPTRLVLSGIAVGAGCGAAVIILTLRMNPHDFMFTTIWLSGSIWGANWRTVIALLPWIMVLVPFVIYKARYLNVLNLGDNIAIGLGTAIEKERRVLLGAAVGLAGSCVAVGGGITFLGLVSPHLARRLVGPKHQILLPTTALIGALLLLIADTIARNLLAPASIPVGIVVSALGAPYFIYLLIKSK